MSGLVVRPDGVAVRESTEREAKRRQKRRLKSETQEAEEKARREARKASLTLKEDASIADVRRVLGLLVQQEVETLVE